MGGRLEREIRQVPRVIAVSVVDDRVLVLVEPGADAISIERQTRRVADAAGWAGRIDVLGGLRRARRAPGIAAVVPRRWTLVAGPIAAATAIMVASLAGGVSKPPPGIPSPAEAPFVVPRALPGVSADDAAPPSAAPLREPAPATRPVVPHVLRLPTLPSATIDRVTVPPVSTPAAKPLPRPSTDPMRSPPHPDTDLTTTPRPDPRRPKPATKPPATSPDATPPRTEAPNDRDDRDDDDRDDDDRDDDDRGDDGGVKKGKAKTNKGASSGGDGAGKTKTIGHDEADKKPKHVEHNGEKHGARRPKGRSGDR